MSNQENELQEGSNKRESEIDDKRGSLEKLSEDLEELEKINPQIKRFIQLSMGVGSISSSPLVSSIQDKINEQHISQLLNIVEKEDERTFYDTQSARKYSLITIILFLIFFGFLTVFLINKDVILFQEILKLFIAFLGGFGSGIGYKGYLDRKSKNIN